MSRKEQKKNGPAPNEVPPAGDLHLLQKEIERIRELIAGKHSKAALQFAKDLYKRCATVESEWLLTDAYMARIDDLLRLGMTVEAKTLLGIVRERFPSARTRLTQLDREVNAQDGRLEEVVAPLADEHVPAEVRERIETFIRERIWDLSALGSVSSLPPKHSLRKGAAALAAAFQAVTAGPVEDAALALPEVSLRSPLAPWKALVWAIACYYRREDEECSRWLQTIPIDSVPARLIPAFAAMLKANPGAGTDSKLSSAEQKLIAAAGDHGRALRSALSDVEEALQANNKKRFLEAVRTAMAAADHLDAATRERLRQHMAVRSALLDIDQRAFKAAAGGAARWDAYYFRLMARGLEDRRSVEDSAEAAAVWSDFRREAIKEKWFAPGGLEDGVLALHMAELVERVPAEIIEDLKQEMADFRKPGPWKQDEGGVPSCNTLYERACTTDPHPEAFQKWLNWAGKHATWQEADKIAERWRDARSADIQPLLYLMDSAEKRSAFKKSLHYLEEAEQLDRLNPEVRRARLRLLLAAALRHLHQRKAHLALREIEQIEAVQEVRPGETATLAAALRWGAAAVAYDMAVQKDQEAALNTLVGSVAAHLLIASVAKNAEMFSAAPSKAMKVTKLSAAELLGGVARACVLGEEAGLSIELPREWNQHLIAALNLPNCPLEAAQMRAMGEAALSSHSEELGYAVSTAGLASGSANAEFLFLRARSLPLLASIRREGCLTASLELARRERNMELAGRILDQLSGKNEDERKRRRLRVQRGDDPRIGSRDVSPELLGKILENEQLLKQHPGYGPGNDPSYAEDLGYSACDCPKCRARRSETGQDGDFFDEDEDDDFDEDEEDLDPLPPSLKKMAQMLDEVLGSLPPKMASALAQELKRAMDAGEDPITAIDRVVGSLPRPPRSPARPKKAERVSPPEQGSLF